MSLGLGGKGVNPTPKTKTPKTFEVGGEEGVGTPPLTQTQTDFWKVSGSVAGFVVTVQCLSAAPSCTHISRALDSSLIKLWISHLKSFLFAWPCVFLF